MHRGGEPKKGWSGRWKARGSRALLAVLAVGLTAASAALVRERAAMVEPLVALELQPAPKRFDRPAVEPVLLATPEAAPITAASDEEGMAEIAAGLDAETLSLAKDPQVRWFDGRPVRPAKQLWMTVTGYSPDAQSCGDSADGITATLHSVFTNGMKLVAADTRILPFGSMVTIDGYDSGQVVPVLDRGGAIKGNKLDLLFPTHEEAREWGKKRMLVTVWEYADGLPAPDPRKLR